MTETVAYEITGTIGQIEFRKYPRMVLATVPNDDDDSGFNLLFAYITGNNKARKKIPMSAPVITLENTPEKIQMTAPVLSDENTMSFVMPGDKQEEDMPDPLDQRVKITTLPQREIAVVQFKGYAGRDDVNAAKALLLDGLKKAGITSSGQPVLMRYNAPWTPGFLRRNEVGIEITR
jgi:hypothetical protein